MDLKEYLQHDATGLARAIKTRKIDVETIYNCAIERLNAVNPLINAVIQESPELAKKQFKTLSDKAPFYGVPFLIKVNFG